VSDSSSGDSNKPQSKQARHHPDKRYAEICPVDGGQAGVQKKLWNRFESYLKEISGAARHKMIRLATKVIADAAKITSRKIRGQATIEGLFAKQGKPKQDADILQPSSAEIGLPPTSIIASGTTRSFPRYDVEKVEQFVLFRWLGEPRGNTGQRRPKFALKAMQASIGGPSSGK